MNNRVLLETRQIIYSGTCKYYVASLDEIGGGLAINTKHFFSPTCDKSSIGVMSSLCNTVLDKCMQGLSSLLSSYHGAILNT